MGKILSQKCPDDKYRDADQMRRHATPMQLIIAQLPDSK